ncbi:hypothetical protein QYF36_014630 [Acer negundo]|nr:hypothetical protein QYF36_014630 [Acer negundo]
MMMTETYSVGDGVIIILLWSGRLGFGHLLEMVLRCGGEELKRWSCMCALNLVLDQMVMFLLATDASIRAIEADDSNSSDCMKLVAY